jgi:hypothetical protein
MIHIPLAADFLRYFNKNAYKYQDNIMHKRILLYQVVYANSILGIAE